MLDIADEGAKVLHNRCVEVGEKFGVPIVAKSTFKKGKGTIISNKTIEGCIIKNIVKNDKLFYIHGFADSYSIEMFNKIYKNFIENEIGVKNLINNSTDKLDIYFTIPKDRFNKFANLVETKLKIMKFTYEDIIKISIIGNGIMSNNSILKKIVYILNKFKLQILSIETTESKISILYKKDNTDDITEKLHETLI